MNRTLLRHVALPAVAPAAIVGLYFTPVLLFGCVNRGLLALARARGHDAMARVLEQAGAR